VVVIKKKRASSGDPPLIPARAARRTRPIPLLPFLERTERETRTAAVLREMQARWPHLFKTEKPGQVPWKKGLSLDVQTALPEFPAEWVKDALRLYQFTVRPFYFLALFRGGVRFGLDGKPSGYVSSEEKEDARKRLLAFHAEQAKRHATQANTEVTIGNQI